VNSAADELLDSNVLVYAFTSDRRAEKTQGLLARLQYQRAGAQ
jgi:predicted nucleic acid-binding protein